ncbi:MAG: hypothetical protein GX455_09240 [Phycisphaerae bacterium]|nr:hypothetical protein [Phycisphaerae bacterium]
MNWLVLKRPSLAAFEAHCDMALLSGKWMNIDCSFNHDCNAADQDASGLVDFGDLLELADRWLMCVTI